jgi:hypothetical protein
VVVVGVDGTLEAAVSAAVVAAPEVRRLEAVDLVTTRDVALLLLDDDVTTTAGPRVPVEDLRELRELTEF